MTSLTWSYAQAPVVKFTSATGVRVLVQPDANSDVVAICVFVRAGIADEEGRSGVGSLAARALFGSNYQQSSDAVRHAIYEAGGSLESRWTPDYTVFTCMTGRETFRDALKVLATALKSAEFDAETLDRARREMADDIIRETTDPFRVGYATLRARLYSDSPYRMPFGGTEESLRRLDASAVSRFFARRYIPDNTVIAIVGNVTEAQARRDVANQFVDYDRTAPPTRPVLPARPDPVAEEGRFVRRLPIHTTMLLAGFRAPSINDPDFAPFVVLHALLGGGKSSRLFRQVRDAAGVGYAVGTYFPPLATDGHLVAYVEFDPARRGEQDSATRGASANSDGAGDIEPLAEKLLLETIASVLNTPPAAKEVERAKRYAAGTHALAHQRARDRAFHLGWYETVGVGYAFDTDLPRRLATVTPDDVLRVAKKYLGKHVVVVVQPER